MPQQISLFSGTIFQGLPTHFHLPKSIAWKVAGCFALVVGSLILLALRFMRQAPNNSLGHSTSASSNLTGRVDQHALNEAPKTESKEREGAKKSLSPTPAATPSVDVPKAVVSQEVIMSGTSGKDGWTVSSVNGEVTVSFSMNSNEIIDKTKQVVDDSKTGIDRRRALKSEIFTFDGEEYCLSFSHKDEDLYRFVLEKTSNLKKASEPPVKLKYTYMAANNPAQQLILELDFSKENSHLIFTPRRFMKVAGGSMVTFTVSFLKPETT